MLKIQKDIESVLDENYDLQDKYNDFFYNLSDKEEGQTYDLLGHKFHVIEAETHWENVDLECCSGDKVTTLVFTIDKDKKNFYSVRQAYNSWGDSGPDEWVKVKKKEKTIIVWEPIE